MALISCTPTMDKQEESWSDGNLNEFDEIEQGGYFWYVIAKHILDHS